jgi:hypothetical protein
MTALIVEAACRPRSATPGVASTEPCARSDRPVESNVNANPLLSGFLSGALRDGFIGMPYLDDLVPPQRLAIVRLQNGQVSSSWPNRGAQRLKVSLLLEVAKPHVNLALKPAQHIFKGADRLVRISATIHALCRDERI